MVTSRLGSLLLLTQLQCLFRSRWIPWQNWSQCAPGKPINSLCKTIQSPKMGDRFCIQMTTLPP